MFGTVMFSVEMFAGNAQVGAPSPPTPPVPPTPPTISMTSGGRSVGKLVQVEHRDFYANGEKAHFERQLVRRPWQR